MTNSIKTFKNYFGKKKEIPSLLYTSYFDLVNQYVEKLEPQNKNKVKQEVYITLMYLFTQCLKSGYTVDELFNPSNIKQYLVLRTYFNSLLELIETMHPNEKEYNPQIYKYLVNNEELDEDLLIIENYNNPSMCFRVLPGKNLQEYLKDNKYGITLSGTIFKNHENIESLFAKILNELYALRKQYKAEMYKHPEGSFDYIEFNRRQLTTKVLMNTLYGILGLNSFRYSNKWLVKTITGQGRYTLKIAQYLCEMYLRTLKEN